MLGDWYIKILNEHPLVTYLEDPVRVSDVEGWKVVKSAVQAKHEHVKIGVSKWFKSDLAQIKEWTQMIAPNEDEEVEVEEGEEPPEDPNLLKFVPDMIHLSR